MMATTKQKQAARKNIKKAQKARSGGFHGTSIGKTDKGLSTATKNRISKTIFAFEGERKEPLTDASHVRNAIARFDQVEGVTDAERDKAWKRIRTAAANYDVAISARDWRDLFKDGKAKKKNASTKE
ncbi:MAG: DUF6582 domain-containing protein [Acidimicrobiales bacterium]|jgi:hypothetical protein